MVSGDFEVHPIGTAAELARLRAALSAADQQGVQVPQGLKALSLEPTDVMLDEGAQRLVSWGEGSKWPDSWSRLQVKAAKNEAERVWRSMWVAAPEAPAQAASPQPPAEPARAEVSDITTMVNRFLTWPVPAEVHPDGTPGQPGRTGTNLLNAQQARAMLEHVLAVPPSERMEPNVNTAQALEALDSLEAAARGDEPFPHFAAALIRAALSNPPVAQEQRGDAERVARHCHVFNVTKTGALTEWEPTTMAFALPDGKHALYTTPPAQASDADSGRMSEAWSKCKAECDPSGWTVADAVAYRGFFAHGWDAAHKEGQKP